MIEQLNWIEQELKGEIEPESWEKPDRGMNTSEHRNGKAGRKEEWRSERYIASRHWHLRFIMGNRACFNMEKLGCHPDIRQQYFPLNSDGLQ